MLLRFQVANHASIRDELEISFVAGDDRPERAQRPVPGTRLTTAPVAAVYGANASGKSNVLSALTWMRRAVLDSFRRWDPAGGVPRRPFRLRADPGTHPSTYELDFVVDGVRYEFGFTVDGERVCEEWLYCFPEGKRRKLYSRTGEGPESLTFGRSLTGKRKTIAELLRPALPRSDLVHGEGPGHARYAALSGHRLLRTGLPGCQGQSGEALSVRAVRRPAVSRRRTAAADGRRHRVWRRKWGGESR